MTDLKSNIKKAIQNSGYPLEQRVGHFLAKNEWIPFHSVKALRYIDHAGKINMLAVLFMYQFDAPISCFYRMRICVFR